MDTKNPFYNDKKHHHFAWENMGDIKEGREDMGEEMPILFYRMLQYTMLDVLSKAHGLTQANEYFRQAGRLAGIEFAKNGLHLAAEFNAFIANLEKLLRDLKIGVLRMEYYDSSSGRIVLTISKDLDCSGLPITNENVCTFDEGFIAGILDVYTGKNYDVREVDCWANGKRICRFIGNVTT